MRRRFFFEEDGNNNNNNNGPDPDRVNPSTTKPPIPTSAPASIPKGNNDNNNNNIRSRAHPQAQPQPQAHTQNAYEQSHPQTIADMFDADVEIDRYSRFLKLEIAADKGIYVKKAAPSGASSDNKVAYDDIGLVSFINTGRMSQVSSLVMVNMINRNTSVETMNSKLDGLKNRTKPKIVIPMVVLCDLRHNGLLLTHLRNEEYKLSSGVKYIVVQLIVTRLAFVKDPYKCILINIVFESATGSSVLKSTYDTKAQSELKFSSDGSLITGDHENVHVTTDHKELDDAEGPNMIGRFADEDFDELEEERKRDEEEEMRIHEEKFGKKKLKHKLNASGSKGPTGLSTGAAIVDDDNEVMQKIKQRNALRDEMDKQLRMPGMLHNWFYSIGDVKPVDEIYSLAFCN